LYILSENTHQTVSKLYQMSRRDTKSHATLLEQAQALDAAQAHMLGVSEQVSLAELATELAEVQAAFMDQLSGNAPCAMTVLEYVQKSLARCFVGLQSYDTPYNTFVYADLQLIFFYFNVKLAWSVASCIAARSLQLQLHLHVILQT
jgi:hypothetical protein